MGTKKDAKKLSLKKQTVRPLDMADLEQVAGGLSRMALPKPVEHDPASAVMRSMMSMQLSGAAIQISGQALQQSSAATSSANCPNGQNNGSQSGAAQSGAPQGG